MPRKLKVFRTPIGFHDAYVAAPSQKAALEAWGSEANLFARGTAEQVTDPRLTAEPLKRPGEVIRVSRGDLKAQLKALSPRKKAKAKAVPERKSAAKARKAAKPKPPPKRDRVDRAEGALAEAHEKQRKARAVLERQQTTIERQLGTLKVQQEKEIARLEKRIVEAKKAYRSALEKWGE